MSLVPSPLSDRHEAEGARFGEFAGWRMPISYEGTVAEHTAVRGAVGVFDVSHLGSVWITGPGAGDAVAGSFTNDPTALADGESQYTLCATQDGGVLDDLIAYRVEEDRWLTIPNASNTAGVVARLEAVSAELARAVTVSDESRDWAILAVQGPEAFATVERVTGVAPDELSFGQHRPVEVDGVEGRLCRTGYTGERGVELVVPTTVCGSLWDELRAAGAVPCGLAARDTLRLEMGYPLHGNDLSPSISPYEARLGWAVKLGERAFVGRDALAAAKADGVPRRLWGLVGDGRRPPRAGMTVEVEGAAAGEVTSGSFSPTLGVGIGLALLDAEVAAGATATVDVRGTDVPFVVTRPPLVDRDPR